MVHYDTKSWFQVMWHWEGTVLPAIGSRLLWLVAISIAVLAGYEVLERVFNVRFGYLNPLGHTLIGLAMGLLVVFRTNASYDRFWEGRKMWGGIVNTTRNLARGAVVFGGANHEDVRWIAAYPFVLKQHLRGIRELDEVSKDLPSDVFTQLLAAVNPPSVLAWHLSDWIRQRIADGRLSVEMGRQLETYVAQLLDLQGGCERILKTPIPFVYAVHIKHLLMVYLVTLPFVLVPVMSWCTPLCTLVIAFGLLGIEEAGVEIEDPFGDDPNDLPLDEICAGIQKSVMELASAGPGHAPA